MDGTIAEGKERASRMGAAEAFGAGIVGPRCWKIKFERSMRHGPNRTPHVIPVQWVPHADPGCGQAELVPLSDHEHFTRAIGNLPERYFAVAIENAGIVATFRVNYRRVTCPGTGRVDISLRANI